MQQKEDLSLLKSMIFTKDKIGNAKSVLNAASMTYVAGLISQCQSFILLITSKKR
jgi:Zn-dependent membrane protease YugP